MNVMDSALPIAVGRVDTQGRLTEAESKLHELNARAGGSIGAPLAVPQIATLTRLAQRLGITISRHVIVLRESRRCEGKDNHGGQSRTHGGLL